jgi:predicted AAA+ superfamily ATPase
VYRSAIEQLKVWKDKPGRMPLLLIGARQTGKTWLLKHFGEHYFEKIAYISFDNNKSLNTVLESTVSPKELLPVLSAATGVSIKPNETLIVLDEIQVSPRALLSLKYFCEEAPEYHVLAAGSTLGVMLHEHASFPVGKVEFLDIHPLSFDEFLRALSEEQLADYIKEQSPDKFRPFHDKLIRILKEYMYVGGMPAAVAAYANQRGDFAAARSVQEAILRAYDRDFSKYATPLLSEKLRMTWNSIPAQLSKENKKFTYAAVKKSMRGRELTSAIQWLKDSSMIGVVNKVTAPMHPLKAYEDVDIFKLFMNDIGLLSAMVDLETQMLTEPNDIFVEFKGALAEQFAFQELRYTLGKTIYYWSKESSTIDIDFLIQNHKGQPLAIEIKSGINLRAKSLKYYIEKYKPEYAVRASLSDFKVDDTNKIIDLPLYAFGKIKEYL